MSEQGLITLRQLFAACHDFADLLGRQALLSLATVSREVWNLARGVIEERYCFRVKLNSISGENPVQFRHYAPRTFESTGLDANAPMFVVPESVTSLCVRLLRSPVRDIRAGDLDAHYIYALPSRLEELTFCDAFNSPVNNLPPSLTHLTFGTKFNQPVDDLPPSLTHLTFGGGFNQPILELPASLTHLTFGYGFNQRHYRLPPSLTHLTFGGDFNQRIKRLPASVTHLQFGSRFNQGVDRLPSGVTHLTFGDDFNQGVDRLPRGVTHLSFGWYFDQRVDFLPPGVTHLAFGLRFRCPVEHLPPSLTHLTLGTGFSRPFVHLPPCITDLPFWGRFNQSVGDLGAGVTPVEVGPGSFQRTMNALQSDVTRLALHYSFDGPLDRLARQLEFLRFYTGFSRSLEWTENGDTVTWLESGQPLPGEGCFRNANGCTFRWRKPAQPSPLRDGDGDGDEEEAESITKRGYRLATIK